MVMLFHDVTPFVINPMGEGMAAADHGAPIGSLCSPLPPLRRGKLRWRDGRFPEPPPFAMGEGDREAVEGAL